MPGSIHWRTSFAFRKMKHVGSNQWQPDAPDVLLAVGSQGVVLGPLYQLEVAHGGKLQVEVLQRVRGPVGDCDVQHDVILVDCHTGLCVDRI